MAQKMKMDMNTGVQRIEGLCGRIASGDHIASGGRIAQAGRIVQRGHIAHLEPDQRPRRRARTSPKPEP